MKLLTSNCSKGNEVADQQLFRKQAWSCCSASLVSLHRRLSFCRRGQNLRSRFLQPSTHHPSKWLDLDQQKLSWPLASQSAAWPLLEAPGGSWKPPRLPKFAWVLFWTPLKHGCPVSTMNFLALDIALGFAARGSWKHMKIPRFFCECQKKCSACPWESPVLVLQLLVAELPASNDNWTCAAPEMVNELGLHWRLRQWAWYLQGVLQRIWNQRVANCCSLIPCLCLLIWLWARRLTSLLQTCLSSWPVPIKTNKCGVKIPWF